MTKDSLTKVAAKNPFLVLCTNIFARVWALWGLLTFAFTFLIIFIPSMLSYLFKNELKGQYYFIKVSNIWMNVWLRIIACPLTVTGKENFIARESYVVVYNHNTFLDVPLSAPFVPGANKTIAKASFTKVPLFGMFYKRGSVLVDRNNDKSRVKSYDAMRKVLAAGMHMCIYPEGTRNRTTEPLKPFYDGAFKLAVESKKEIIPCLIFGTREAMPVSKPFYLVPTKLRMHFLPAVSSENIEVKALKEKVHSIMAAHYVENA
jgi:1-acyl-sn-glycerol-3-phosphate acyltransferase